MNSKSWLKRIAEWKSKQEPSPSADCTSWDLEHSLHNARCHGDMCGLEYHRFIATLEIHEMMTELLERTPSKEQRWLGGMR